MAARIISQRFGFTGQDTHLDRIPGPEHTHAEVELNLLEGHPITYLFAGAPVAFPCGRWLAYWAALPHRVLTIGTASRMSWITVPMAQFLSWASADLVDRLLAGAIVIQPQGEPGAHPRARSWIEALGAPGPERRRIATLEIEALVRRLSLEGEVLAGGVSVTSTRGPDGNGRQRRLTGVPEGVLRMCAHLAQNYRETVRIADCAAVAGLAPSSAMALFRATCGSTIGQYLIRLRLAHAQRLLLTTRQGILEIALDAGFGSQARFYVAFRRAFATTPVAFRRSHAQDRGPGEA